MNYLHFSDSLCRNGVQVLLTGALVVTGCKDNPTASTPEPPPISLQVERSEGVDGTPAAGSVTLPKGSVVAYSFSSRATYTDLIVTLNGRAVPASGSFSLDATKTLLVSATPRPVVRSEDATLVVSANAILSSSDPAKAFAQHLLAVDILHRNLAATEAAARINEVDRQAAITTTATEAQRLAIHQALGGRTFWLNAPSATSVANSLAEGSHQAADKPLTYLFVNGILNMPAGAAGSAGVLRGLIAETPNSSTSKVGIFYNVSWAYNKSTLVASCLLPLLDQLGWDIEPLIYTQSALRCLASQLDVLDLPELRRQLLDVTLGYRSEAEPDARILAAAILQEINQGRRVIIVAHSQGNLMTQQALNVVKQTALPGINPMPCIGVLRYAPPSSSNWTVETSAHLNGFVLEGDITRLLGQNNDMTPLTSSRSTRLLGLARLLSVAGAPISWLAELTAQMFIHDVQRGYMIDADARAASLKGIEVLRNAVSQVDGCDGAFKIILASSGQDDGSGPSDLYLVSPLSEGRDQLIARLRDGTGSSPPITDLAWCPGGELFAISYFDLYRVNYTTGILERISAHGRTSANALTCTPNGDLYMGAGSSLYQFDAQRLTNTRVGSTSQGTYSGDIAFDRAGSLFATLKVSGESSDVLVKVDPRTGATSRIGSTGFGNIWGITFVENTLYGLTTSSSGVGSLIRIETSTGAGTRVRSLSFDAFGSTVRASK